MELGCLIPLIILVIDLSQTNANDEILKRNNRHQVIKNVHKFSIGKDFNSLEQFDENKLKNLTYDVSIYSNIPPSLSTKIIKTENITNTTTASTTTLFPTSTDKIESIKEEFASLKQKSKHLEALNEVLNDVLTVSSINFTKITKGRSIEDTKAILNYMLTSWYHIKAKESDNRFDSVNFLDQVLVDPLKISPDGLFEKDIVLSKDQAYRIFSKHLGNNSSIPSVKKVIKDIVFRWPLPIHYYLDSNYVEPEKDLLRKAIKRWEEQTCLEFKELPNVETQVHHLRIIKGQGCWSPVGYYPQSTYQDLSLGEGCLLKGTILHEIGHTLGFYHEQSRPDRDEHVNIIWKNISPYGELNFEKYSDLEITNYEVPYDLSSDMHYGSLYFSANGDITIEPKDKRYQRTIGQRLDLSFSDIKAANKFYCQNRCPISLPCQRGGYPNPKNCQTCLCPDGFSGTYCDEVAPSIGLCGGLMRNTTGLLQTPNYPLYYPGFISCNWLIQAPPGYRVRLSFSKLFSTTCNQFATAGPCDQDWVEIRENSDTFYQGGPRYCCTQGPTTTISVDNEMVLLFRSSIGNVNSNGFRAIYEFIDSNGNVLTESTTTSTTSTSSTTTTSSTIPTPLTTLTNFCSNQACLNGGTCISNSNGFECFCIASYTGVRCETKVSRCSDIKCENNGICLENLKSCLCPSGFTGERCETALDSCSSNPCVKGVCVNLNSDDGYKCFCLANFTGPRCEISLQNKLCKEDLCLNGGKCIESPLLEGFICKCPKNYNGIFCEKSLCSNPDVCGGNGTCFLKEEGGYYCKCQDGSIGENCKSHPCLANVCGEFGVCQRMGTDYECECKPGFIGKNCNIKIKACESNPCVNGKCKDLFNFDFECECESGFVGKRCDIPFNSNSTKSICYSNPCKNNGICFEKFSLSQPYVCFCPPGFVGQNCEFLYSYDLDICNLKPGLCKHGKCVSNGNSHECKCDKNWFGRRCDLYNTCLNPNPCQNNGTCIPLKKEYYICRCNSNFSGKNCENLINECSKNPCLNGGTCLADNLQPQKYKCLCPPNIVGPNCTFNLNSCSSNPCLFDQVCKNKGETYECLPLLKRNNTSFNSFISLFSKHGQLSLCEILKPCKNDGICEQIGRYNFVCKCRFGFEGKNCEFLNKCLFTPNICKNNGICQMTDGKPSCHCPEGFEPPFCETFSSNTRTGVLNQTYDTYCEINVCKNGGTCVHANLYENKMYGMKCLCPKDFSGIFCEKDDSLNERTKQIGLKIPSICDLTENSKELELHPLRFVRLPYTNDSFYLIQNDLVWYIEQGLVSQVDQISSLFNGINGQIDAILYDYLKDDVLIFKLNKYWRFKRNLNAKHSFNMLIGYPKTIKEDFGIKSIQSGFFANQNSLLLFKDSKIVHYNRTKAIGIHFLPSQLSRIQFAMNIDLNNFVALSQDKLYSFYINYKNHHVFTKSVRADLINTFICEPFIRNIRPKVKQPIEELNGEFRLRQCPELTSVDSIIKLNSSHAIMLTEGKNLEYLNYGINGYKPLKDSKKISLGLNPNESRLSMISFNRILFLFQNDLVWIYSMLNDSFVKNPLPSQFENLFPNKHTLNSIVSSHYSPKTKKFYFFSEKYYIEYENQNKFQRKNSIRNLSSKLTHVIQNHEDYDSVYLIDANNFVYYLNLKNDYLESVNRRTASLKLFTNCIHI